MYVCSLSSESYVDFECWPARLLIDSTLPSSSYQAYKPLQDIFLGDSVRVIAPRIGVEVSMRMTQYTYDCLQRRYKASRQSKLERFI